MTDMSMPRFLKGALAGLLALVIGIMPVAAGPLTPTQSAAIFAGATCPLGNALTAAVDIQFVQNCATTQGGGTTLPASLLTTTRASSGYAQWADGHLSSFAANTPRITDQGLLVEEARTNVVLWSRALTNAAWTKTSITAALNQMGADGAANSATSLTATAGNGTCLQAITLASAAAFQSAYVKRITGSGTIQMTMDNGATWTTIVVTAAYTKLSIPTQTLANPTVGFRIVTSGDTIAVDFVQNENGTFASSPILTTSASATRAADRIQFTGAALAAVQAPIGWARVVTPFGINNVGGAYLVRRQQTPNDAIFQPNSATTVRSLVSGGAFSQVTIGGSGTWAGAVKAASTWDASGIANAANGGTVATSATPFSAISDTNTFLGSGDGSTASGFIGNYISRLTFGTGTKLSNTQLQALSQ